ncbi:MAG TPA: NAD(+)/NADH kinase [Jatrophihabitantaceae bacterium]|jgi:NAD+ kinase
MTLHRIGIVVHEGKDVARNAAQTVRDWGQAHDVAVVGVDVWTENTGSARRNSRDEAAEAGYPDLIVTIGGDGTFLRGARIAAVTDAAVLGVDVGRVGFLTEVGVDDLTRALDAVRDETAIIEERLTLNMRASRRMEIPPGIDGLLRYGRGPRLPPPPVRASSPDDVGWGVGLDVMALNDVVFEKLARDRQASLAVYVSGRLFASYSADALVVSSPTGSTAYSFAAGGPVLSPRAEAIVFTPVAPHMIFDRSLVLAGDEPVAVRVLKHSGQVAVSVDGQLRGVLDPGDWFAVYGGRRRARLVRLRPSDFLGRLRSRFGLADAAAAAADGSAPLEYRPDTPPPADIRHLYMAPPVEETAG